MNARTWGAMLSTIFVFTACDSGNVAGTNNETHTKGTLYQANGKVAAGARVRIFAANQAVGDSLPVEQTKADANGRISLKLKRGYYSLLANDTAGRAVFIDSILSTGDKVEFDDDTLRPTGTLTGHLRVQPMHSPAIAWVHVMRTNLFANVDSSGAFRIEGVPEGKMEVVALSHLPEYTPTFREAQAFSDSTVDIGTIDLVYNGLPLVTGLAASYDSLTGVVTVTWKDTAYARKNGYVVYRGQGKLPTLESNETGSIGTNGTIGSATISTYSDTVFGGFGTTPSRYDSAEFDLTYWVAAQSSDYSTGPVWNKAILHVKSPALAKRWKVEWSGLVPQPGSGTSVDTLASGLALLDGNRLQILSTGGTWTQGTIPAPSDGNLPAFWRGSIWKVAGHSSHTGIAVQNNPGNIPDTLRCPIFDSLVIYSSRDGNSWDSLVLPVPNDSVTGFRLQPTASGLFLVMLTRYYRPMPGIPVIQPRGRFVTADGTHWRQDAQPNPLIDGGTSDLMFHYKAPATLSFSDTRTWSILTASSYTYPDGSAPLPHKVTYLIPGISDDTTLAILRDSNPSTTSFKIRDGGNMLAMHELEYPKARLGIAYPETPDVWQAIAIPEPIYDFCFWKGKLVVLGETGLHFATITPNQ